MNINEIKKHFHDQNENLVSILGQGYLTGLLQGNFSRSVLLLTDKRIYQKGRVFASNRGSFASYKGEKVCQVQDIAGTSYVEIKKPLFLLLGVLLTIPGIWLFTLGAFDEEESAILVGLALFFLLPTPMFIAYSILTIKLFTVEHAGGLITVQARWYSEVELQNFAKQIFLVKDKIDEKKLLHIN